MDYAPCQRPYAYGTFGTPPLASELTGMTGDDRSDLCDKPLEVEVAHDAVVLTGQTVWRWRLRLKLQRCPSPG
jgi:hypothetical protein